MFGKLKKDERKELEELRQKEIKRLEEDIEVIKKCLNMMSVAVQKNRNSTEEFVGKLAERVEKLEDKEIDKEIDDVIEAMYH